MIDRFLCFSDIFISIGHFDTGISMGDLSLKAESPFSPSRAK